MVSDKVKLENGDEYYLIEKNILDEGSEIKINNNAGFIINAESIRRKTTSRATIFLTREDDYVGHISAILYNDGTASLMMAGITGVELPSELEQYRAMYMDNISKHDAALLVDEKYRRQGKASLLMSLMFQYLDKKGIKDLEVCDITDDVAMRTYLSTGAEIIGPKKAIYRNIKRFIQKQQAEDLEK